MKAMLALVGALLVGLSAPAHAHRHVVVNGERLNPAQIAYLDRVNCTVVPNGYYWVNMHTGAWGYAGNPVVQGYVGQQCRGPQRHRSLSERGMLFGPQDFRNRW